MVDWYLLLLLCLAAFAAGFVDAIVGGGGLIQLPVALVLLPSLPVASVVGSLKIPAFTGTAVAAWQYVKRVTMQWRLLTVVCTIAFFSAYAGSWLLTQVSNAFMKPVLVVVLAAIAIYTFTKKNFGQTEARTLPVCTQLVRAIIISLVIGFYDGFIGPGTGSLLVLLFIAALGFDFLHASAHGKLVNLATNLGSVTLFVLQGKIIGGIKLILPFKAQPLHILFDALHILGFFRYRVGVIKAQVGVTAVFFGKAEVEIDRGGVANVEVAIWLRRETGDDALMFTLP